MHVFDHAQHAAARRLPLPHVDVAAVRRVVQAPRVRRARLIGHRLRAHMGRAAVPEGVGFREDDGELVLVVTHGIRLLRIRVRHVPTVLTLDQRHALQRARRVPPAEREVDVGVVPKRPDLDRGLARAAEALALHGPDRDRAGRPPGRVREEPPEIGRRLDTVDHQGRPAGDIGPGQARDDRHAGQARDEQGPATARPPPRPASPAETGAGAGPRRHT
jgi:hypothetical protein